MSTSLPRRPVSKSLPGVMANGSGDLRAPANVCWSLMSALTKCASLSASLAVVADATLAPPEAWTPNTAHKRPDDCECGRRHGPTKCDAAP